MATVYIIMRGCFDSPAHTFCEKEAINLALAHVVEGGHSAQVHVDGKISISIKREEDENISVTQTRYYNSSPEEDVVHSDVAATLLS